MGDHLKLVQLHRLPVARVRGFLPIPDIERVIGTTPAWRVLQTQAEMLDWHHVAYNTVVMTDAHRRWLFHPEVESVVPALFPYRDEPDFFRRFPKYKHNQCAIEGRVNGILCAKLHLGVVADRFLYVHELALANPNVPCAKPLDPDQTHAGLGNGIFAEVLQRVRMFAGDLHLASVIGYAADADRVAIFERKGFALDHEDPILQSARISGLQFPIKIAPLRIQGRVVDSAGHQLAFGPGSSEKRSFRSPTDGAVLNVNPSTPKPDRTHTGRAAESCDGGGLAYSPEHATLARRAAGSGPLRVRATQAVHLVPPRLQARCGQALHQRGHLGREPSSLLLQQGRVRSRSRA